MDEERLNTPLARRLHRLERYRDRLRLIIGGNPSEALALELRYVELRIEQMYHSPLDCWPPSH